MSKGGRGRGARRAWFLPLNLVLDPSPEGTHLDPFGPIWTHLDPWSLDLGTLRHTLRQGNH